MTDTNTNTNIDDYSVEDLLSIFNLTEPTPFNVTDVANSLIARMHNEGKPELVGFFEKARDKVLAQLASDVIKQQTVRNETTESLNKIWMDSGLTSNGAAPIKFYGDASHVVAENKQLRKRSPSLYILIKFRRRGTLLMRKVVIRFLCIMG